MKQYHRERFREFILDRGLVHFSEKPIPLSSGRTSHWYVNWRTVTEDVYLTEVLAETVISFMKQRNIIADTIYGVPEGATKLGLLTQYFLVRGQKSYGERTHAFAMGRGKVKTHGDPKDRYFLGVPRGRTVVLEDVITTGNALIATIDRLVEARAHVVAAIGLTDRMALRDDRKSVLEVLEEKAISYYAMSDALELLPPAYQRLRPGNVVGHAIEKEFEEQGVSRIKLVSEE